MSILKKRVQEGWWKDRKDKNTSIPVDNIDWNQLKQRKSVIVNDKEGTPFRISIPEKEINQLNESDLIIEQLPSLPKTGRSANP